MQHFAMDNRDHKHASSSSKNVDLERCNLPIIHKSQLFVSLNTSQMLLSLKEKCTEFCFRLGVSLNLPNRFYSALQYNCEKENKYPVLTKEL